MNPVFPAVQTQEEFLSSALHIICLCAEWCRACRDYHGTFESLAKEFKAFRFVWVDIEEEAEALGDLDIENFPTLLIRRQDWVLYFGVILPQPDHLHRLLKNFSKMTLDACQDYAQSSEERLAWQNNPDIIVLKAL